MGIVDLLFPVDGDRVVTWLVQRGLTMAYGDALRGYAFQVLKRDDFTCRYCGLDGRVAFSNWVHLSWDHLLPVGHPDRDDERFIVAACRFCNETHNRTVFDIEGKAPEEIVVQKREAILQRRGEYEVFWRSNVATDM